MDQESRQPEEIVKSIQGGENHLRDRLIADCLADIRHLVRKTTRSFADEQDEAFSIALVAFNQAIGQYSTPGAIGGALHQVDIHGTLSTYDPAIYDTIRIDGLDALFKGGTGEAVMDAFIARAYKTTRLTDAKTLTELLEKELLERQHLVTVARLGQGKLPISVF